MMLTVFRKFYASGSGRQRLTRMASSFEDNKRIINVSILLLSIPLFLVFRNLISNGTDAAALAGLSALCLAGLSIKRRDLGEAASLLISGVGILFLVYAALSPLSLPRTSISDNVIISFFLSDGRWALLFLLPFIISRPGLSAFPLSYVFYAKAFYENATGISVSKTDWIIVWEAAAYLTLLSAAISFADRSRSHDRLKSLMDLAVLGVISIHFANYLYSGIAKLLLGPSIYTWLIENPTYSLIATAWHTGLYPLGSIPKVGAYVYEQSAEFVILINAATLMGQLLTVIALRKKIWSRTLTLYFDIQHVAIYILTGIFFWKWIVFNLLIVAALGRVRIGISRRLYGTLVAIMLLAPVFFHIVWLGWYDTRIVSDARFEAVLKDGSRLRLPSNVGLTSSVTLAQARVGRPFEGHVRTGSLGATRDAELMREAKNCELDEFSVSEHWIESASGPNLDKAKKMIAPTMQFIEENNFFGENLYRLNYYAHHMFSNPFLYPQLSGITVKLVEAVDYVVETVCVTVDSGTVGRMLRSDAFRIAERRDGHWVAVE